MDISINDRLAIQDLVCKYNFACDTGDAAALAKLFTEDALFQEGSADDPYIIDARGPREIFEKAHVGMREIAVQFAKHITTSHFLYEEGGELRGKCYQMFVTSFGQICNTGTYYDRYEKQGSDWLFASRCCIIDGSKEQFQASIANFLKTIRQHELA